MKYFRTPFYPLYFDIIEIDPFKKGASEELKRELLSGEVALVWFEILQGQSLDLIPEDILATINENQVEGGYFVGVDEILTGMFRTGNFLCSEGRILNPDIIALAKGASDMIFPTAYVLVSQRVYQSAHQHNPVLVEKLKTHFINQLGAHITLHGISKALEMNLGRHVKEMGIFLKILVQDAVACSTMHQNIVGEGLLLYIKLNKKAFPINILQEEFVEFLMSCHYLKRGMSYFSTRELLQRSQLVLMRSNYSVRGLKKLCVLQIHFYCFCFVSKKIVHIHALCLLQKIKEKFVV